VTPDPAGTTAAQDDCVHEDLLPSDLLLLLHSLVITDGGPSELLGKLAVGVQGELGTYWWAAAFGNEIVTHFPKRAPADADAIFLLGEREALAVIKGDTFEGQAKRAASEASGGGSEGSARAGPADRPRLEIQGDWSLMERFCERYLSHKRRRQAKSGSPPEDQTGLSQRMRRTISSARLRALRGMAP
jgi:hypothetical protein